MSSEQAIQKYVSLYMKKWSILWLSSALLCTIPLLVVSVKYGNFSYVFLPLFAAFVLILIHRLIVARFPKAIKKQEELYSVCFFDHNAERIASKVYLSDDWIIYVGKCALYKQHITEITYNEIRNPKTGLTHEVIFQTQNDEAYTFWIECKESIEKLEKWLKE
ncbi:MAG: hypothetical protein IKM34_05940 [Clostridia bacterium]|nr:hypothetical protein [Clostridia bacterium]